MSLVNRVRLVLSAEDDDFYDDEDDIVEALNASQEDVVSYCLSFEKNRNVSLRALDNLRDIYEEVIDNSRSLSDFWVCDVSIPTDMKNFLALSYNELTPLKELSATKVHELMISNAVPTELQSYYLVANINDTVNFRLYLYEEPDETSDKIEVHFIFSPTPIELETEELVELPQQLENAVVYGAAFQLALKEQSESTKAYQDTYQNYLQNNLF